jgi:sulfane dehydrogenase subunit SoxC
MLVLIAVWKMFGRRKASREDIVAKKQIALRAREPEIVAGNGLLDRRALLGRGVMLAGAIGTGTAGALTGAAAEPLTEAPWSLEPGDVTPPYQRPSNFEKNVVRTVDNPNNEELR